MKKFFLVFFVSFVFSLAILPASEALTIRISTPKIELELAPGETYSGEIVCENPTEEPVNIKAYLEDWEYLANGTGDKKFVPPGTLPLSGSQWITFSPATDIIQPYGRMTARYTVTVPLDVKGAFYSVLFFETLLGTSTNEGGVSVLVAGRVGALFFIHIKDSTIREGKINSTEITAPEGNRPMEIITAFQNTGNIDIILGGNFLIMDPDGKVVGRGDITKMYTFPGGESSRTTQWIGKLPPQDYQLLITYDLGSGKTLVEEKTLTIK